MCLPWHEGKPAFTHSVTSSCSLAAFRIPVVPSELILEGFPYAANLQPHLFPALPDWPLGP